MSNRGDTEKYAIDGARFDDKMSKRRFQCIYSRYFQNEND